MIMFARYVFRLSLGAFAVVACLGVNPAPAQDPDLNATFGSVKLKADFQPDPYVKMLTAGGAVQTNLGGVNAYVEKAPDFKLFYEAGRFSLTIYVESEAATTLLINLPDGTWVAAGGRMPLLEFAKPQSGRYDIWVGTVGKENAPAKLKFTELKIAAPVAGQPNGKQVDAWLAAADRLNNQGDYKQAVRYYEGVLEQVPRFWGVGSVDHASILNNAANAYHALGDYGRAESYHLRSLEIREAKLGPNHRETGISYLNLGNVYNDLRQDSRAEKSFARSLEIFNKSLGPEHPVTANSMNNLGIVYRRQAHFDKSEAICRQALDVFERSLGRDHTDVAAALNNLANVLGDMKRDAEVEPLLVRSVQIYEKKLGKNHPRTATGLNNLGGYYREMGQYAKAEAIQRRALAIRESVLGKDHLDTAQSLNSLSVVYWATGQLSKAEPLQRRSLEIYEASLGKDHPLTGHALNSLGVLYLEGRQFAQAERLLRRSLEVRENSLGKEHFETTRSLENLANTYYEMGELAKAESLYRRCLETREAKLGKDHPETTDALNALAFTFAAQKRWEEAAPLLHRGRQATTVRLATLLPGMSEKEQLLFLEGNFQRDYFKALSLGRTAPKTAAALSAEWLLNGKAVAHQTLAEQVILARDARNPQAFEFAKDLKQTRARLAMLVHRLPQTGQEAQYQEDLQALRAAEQDLEQKLARAVGRHHRPTPWLSLAELQAKLGPRSAFVDIARFTPLEFVKRQWEKPRYVAWITAAKQPVQVIDLGDAEAIDRLVAEMRKTLIESAKSITKVGEVEAADALQKPLQELSAKVLHPLLPAIEKYEEWIVCPDGALWLTPWNALLLPKGEFAVEKYLIRHVVSGRDLVLELPKVKADSAYIFADPDYDLSPGKVLTAAGGLRGGGSSLLGQRLRGSIDTWNVSFDFQADEVLIRDEDGKGEIAGKGTWKQTGNTLTIQTGLSLFQGTIAAGEIRGQCSKRNTDGTTLRDTFRMDFSASDEERSISSAQSTLPRVARLPGTAIEAEAVRPKLKLWLGQEPRMHLESQASETLLKAVKNPRVLALATHGYFLPRQEVDAKGPSGLDKKGQPIENPLLRCGLLLAGCNKRAEAKFGEDDGILTGIEIVGLDLNGCELVVLSACETGLGDVRSGEGVAGLRQAFQLAGAKGVLASLWQVPDRETAFLMNTFYGELTKGRSHAEALRQAQLQRIAARRGQFGAAHPFFWAAFTLTNRGTD